MPDERLEHGWRVVRLEDQPGLQHHQAAQRRRLPSACDPVAPRYQRPGNARAARHAHGPGQRVDVLGVVRWELQCSGWAVFGLVQWWCRVEEGEARESRLPASTSPGVVQ